MRAQANTPAAPSTSTAIPTATYSNAQLALTFTYPANLIARDPLEAEEAGHRAHFGQPGSTDPEHRKAMKCLHPLLLLSTSPGEETPTLVPHPTPGAPAPPSATLFLSEFDRACATPANRANLVGDLAQDILHLPGINPIDKPIWYTVGQQKVHFAAGTKDVVSPLTLRPESLVFISLATEWNNHLLVWVIESNRLFLANRLARGAVAFGTQPPVPLLPFQIGSGTPIQPVP